MATSSVVIAGATYSDVPSVTLKDTSNTDVSFVLTTDADATASDIRKNKIAYSQGQKIVGDYELNLQEKTANSSTSTQVITADTTAVAENKTSSISFLSMSQQSFGNFVEPSTSTNKTFTASELAESYRIVINATEYSQGTTWVAGNTFDIDMTSALSSEVEISVSGTWVSKFVLTPTYNSSTQLYTIALVVNSTIRPYNTGITFTAELHLPAYDGLSKVTINPYTLQSKTATPTTSAQVITADNGSVYSLNLESLLVSSDGQRGDYYSYIWDISALWESTPIVGETYHINIDYYRGGYQAHYYYDADYTFNGFPLSLTLSSSSAANRTLVLTETEIYVRASIDDDTQQNTTLTYQIYKSVSYDGLSQVTVNPIPSEYIIPSGTLSVTNNGTVDVSTYQYAEVNVSGGSQTQSKTATPTTSTQTITPDSGYLLSSVVVNPIPSQYIIPSGTKSITANGTEDVTSYASVSVNVTPSLETKTNITPTTSSQTITPSSGYDGLASVQINAIPSNYIDTTDATASASDIRTGKSGYVNGSKVNGSLVVNKVYVGSTDPSSSFGNDGDIYIKVV